MISFRTFSKFLLSLPLVSFICFHFNLFQFAQTQCVNGYICDLPFSVKRNSKLISPPRLRFISSLRRHLHTEQIDDTIHSLVMMMLMILMALSLCGYLIAATR